MSFAAAMSAPPAPETTLPNQPILPLTPLILIDSFGDPPSLVEVARPAELASHLPPEERARLADEVRRGLTEKLRLVNAAVTALADALATTFERDFQRDTFVELYSRFQSRPGEIVVELENRSCIEKRIKCISEIGVFFVGEVIYGETDPLLKAISILGGSVIHDFQGKVPANLPARIHDRYTAIDAGMFVKEHQPYPRILERVLFDIGGIPGYNERRQLPSQDDYLVLGGHLPYKGSSSESVDQLSYGVSPLPSITVANEDDLLRFMVTEAQREQHERGGCCFSTGDGFVVFTSTGRQTSIQLPEFHNSWHTHPACLEDTALLAQLATKAKEQWEDIGLWERLKSFNQHSTFVQVDGRSPSPADLFCFASENNRFDLIALWGARVLDMRSSAAAGDSIWSWFRAEVERVGEELIQLAASRTPDHLPLWLLTNPKAGAEFGLDRDLRLNTVLKEALRRAGFDILSSDNFPDVLRAWGVPFRIFSVRETQ